MSTPLKKIERILVANRGEIAIRIMRAASELAIRTVAIYTFEDRYSVHRYKADESYQIGKDDDPLKPYLDIEEIIKLAKQKRIDAIHPGYGFLSENVQFATRCREEGIIFIGPAPEVMHALGDKIEAKKAAKIAGVPLIEDSDADLSTLEITRSEAHRIGFPVIIKAASGGGGRGMRVIYEDSTLEKSYNEARAEAKNAFGDDTIFIEKFIENPKHIEIQIMADNHGNIVHLYERDCSVQRRFQKVVEVAPSPSLNQETKDKLYDYAIKLAKAVNYNNVGTVEFLVDKQNNIYFIEVNPRVQVEHTITEEITGIDIVRSQIQIAKGYKLTDNQIYILNQKDIPCNGFAIQCRVTTEDPSTGFKPDFGQIIAYRNAAGFGIRLDEGNCYQGVRVSPYFDSLLLKVIAKGRTLKGACNRLDRSLREIRIRGVKTNTGFLLNVINHEVFKNGNATVNFIGDHPELLQIRKGLDSGTKSLLYLADVIVNGNSDVRNVDKNKNFNTPIVPDFNRFESFPDGSRTKLLSLGREGFIKDLKANPKVQFTDTTFRDAHQSLLATRMRTTDMLKIAESYAKNNPDVFALEMWGGATFDVCMRFLNEDPWKRLQLLREAAPNILFMMLFRGSNAVGYKAYPDNLIEKFIEKAFQNGIDVFRIFDSLNWFDAMKVSIKAAKERTNALIEGYVCYTGDILDPNNHKYTLQYYVDLARKLEDEGVHMLGIKDMAGLLKPNAAGLLITELKKYIHIPIHLHTHDTSALQVATYMKAIEAGVDVLDVALGSMSGLTSQPNFNSVLSMIQNTPYESNINIEKLNQFSNYWEDVREYYYPFESGMKAGNAEVFEHEMPGGQYTNLKSQATAVGLGDKFDLVKKNYALGNKMFGDIVKVTPSSKVVGDFALYMTSNDLTEEQIYEKGQTLSFPDSVIEFFKGDLGQPYGGFPEKLQKIVLKDVVPYTDRPNSHLKPIDFDKEYEAFKLKYPLSNEFTDYLSYALYSKVFDDYYKFKLVYGDVSKIPTPTFFYGLKINEEVLIELAEGKTIIVKLIHAFPPDDNGMAMVAFELNGQTRRVYVKDKLFKAIKIMHRKVAGANEIGSPLQGKLSSILVKAGDELRENQPMFVIEAMKMETTVTAPRSGKVKSVILKEGTLLEQDDMVLEVE